MICPNLESLLFAVKSFRIPRANKQSEISKASLIAWAREGNVSSHIVPLSQRDRIPIDVDHTIFFNCVIEQSVAIMQRKMKVDYNVDTVLDSLCRGEPAAAKVSVTRSAGELPNVSQSFSARL